MILDLLPRPVLRSIMWLYQQKWYHWFASIVFGFWDTVFGVIYRAQERIFRISLWRSWQNRPEPHFPIPMTDNDVPVKPERSDSCGQYIATMIVTYADADEMKAHLPPGVELLEKDIRNGKHAILYLLGYTQNLHPIWSPFPGINYMEFAVGIPSVRIKRKGGYDGPFFYLPTLYLSRFYPVLLGWMVGYRKHWGWVYGQDRTYHVAKLGGKKILSASFDVGTLPAMVMGGPKADPKAAPWGQLLDEPHANPFGPNAFLYLHYHWDWPNALLQPVRADVEVFEDLPGLPRGTHHFGGLNEGMYQDGMAPEGAFRVCAPFEWLPPFSRHALRHWRDKSGEQPCEPTPGESTAAPSSNPAA